MKTALLWTSLYLIIGAFLIFLGQAIDSSPIISETLISIGGAVLAIGLVTVFIEVNSSLKIFQIFSLFGDYKSHGILRIFPNDLGTEFKEFYKEITRNPQDIRILDLIGRKFVEDSSCIEKTVTMIKASNVAKLIFCCIDSHGYNYRYKYLEPLKDDADIIGKRNKSVLKQNYHKLEESIQLLKKPEKELRFYQCIPIFNLEFFDEYLFVSFYGLKSRSKKYSPVILFKKSNSEVYKYFLTQFENYWIDSGAC